MTCFISSGVRLVKVMTCIITAEIITVEGGFAKYRMK